MIRMPLLAAVAFATLVSLAVAFDDAPPPDEPGPWAVGRMTFTLVDPARDDRELTIDAWYPVDPPDANGAMSEYDMSVIWPTLFLPSTLAFDAPPVSSAGPFPLLAHSHGNQDFRFNCKNLAETLASHGLVVVAPGHTGNTPDGGDPDPASKVYLDRPQDISFLITRMLERNADPADAFFGRIDPDRIGASGSSMGGFTTLAVAGGYKNLPPDTRVRAIAPVTPAAWDLVNQNFAAIEVPSLVWTGTEDWLVDMSDYCYRRLEEGTRYFVNLSMGPHGATGIRCEVYEYMVDAGFPQEAIDAYLEFCGGTACHEDLLPEAECNRLANLYIVSFFKVFVEDDLRYQPFLTREYAETHEPDVFEFRAGCTPDCNGNGVLDSEDIASGASADDDGDGIPDECGAAVLYVDSDASGQNHGTTWEDAYTDLQSAIRVASADCSDTVREIWVAGGTYTPDIAPGSRKHSFFVGDRTALYGGFAGHETEREERDCVSNPTLLSGDLAGDDQPGFVNREDNSINIVKGWGHSSLSVLDGFTVRGAYSETAPFNLGGAACLFLGNLTIDNCRFEENQAQLGGAILVVGTGATMRNCIFAGNHALGYGGAVADAGYLYPPTPRITSCTFWDNVAHESGGALSDGPGRAVVSDCILWGNSPNQIQGGSTVVYCDVQGGWPGAGNFSADPQFVNAPGGDFRLRFGSPCIDAGNNSTPALPDTDFEGDERIVDGDLYGVAVVDIGADELLPEVAARFGTVNAANTALADVLRVNGEAGDRKRILSFSVGEAFAITLDTPPAGPAPAPFALYAWLGANDATDCVAQPYGLGIMCFPTLLSGGDPQPVRIWNNIGMYPWLGVPKLPSVPAPSTVVSFPEGWPHPRTVTLQGFILDDGSEANKPASITNAVVLEIE